MLEIISSKVRCVKFVGIGILDVEYKIRTYKIIKEIIESIESVSI